jgi:predicted TIM-barrel fold metal-dependent hydrolase
VDTALAGPREITDFAETFGVDRIIFGSDYPFGIPGHEKRKVVNLFSDDDLAAVLSGNLLRLLGRSSCTAM